MNRRSIRILSLLVISQLASSKVLLMGKNTFLSFDDVEAIFTPIVRSSGEWGLLYAAEPLHGCSDLSNTAEKGSNLRSSYVLIAGGGCSFEEKVRNAKKAGYEAAIVYNNAYDDLLVPMTGDSTGVHIHGVLVTRSSGEALKEYAGRIEFKLWLIPGFGTSSWSIMAIAFVSLLAISLVLATCAFIRRHRIRRMRALSRCMPKHLLQSLPTQVFTGVLEEGSTKVTCAICIDDYSTGDKLRILPCQHKFHAACIDSWLGHWRSSCPVCKRNARNRNGDFPASEKTPLLSPATSMQSVSRQEPLSVFLCTTDHRLYI